MLYGLSSDPMPQKSSSYSRAGPEEGSPSIKAPSLVSAVSIAAAPAATKGRYMPPHLRAASTSATPSLASGAPVEVERGRVVRQPSGDPFRQEDELPTWATDR